MTIKKACIGLLVGLATLFGRADDGVEVVSYAPSAQGHQFTLNFAAWSGEGTRTLYAVHGATDYGTTTNNWPNVENLGVIENDATAATVTVSKNFDHFSSYLRFLLVTVAPPSSTSTSYRQTNLLAQWDGIENVARGSHDSTSTKWNDLSGNGWNSTLNEAGKVNHWQDDSFLFTRNTDQYQYFTVDTKNFQNALGTTWTVEAYVKPTANNAEGYSGICGGHDNGSGLIFMQYDGSYATHLNRGWNATRLSTSEFTANEYHHVVLVANGETKRATLYLDGVQKGDYAVNTTAEPSYPNFWIGWAFDNQRWGNRNFDGNIYTIRAYTAALTADEVKAHWAIDKERFTGGMKQDIKTSAVVSFDATRTLTITKVNRTAQGKVASFELAITGRYEVAGAIYAGFGASDGGAKTSGWDRVEYLGPVDADATSVTVPAPADFGGDLACIRFFRIGADDTFDARTYPQTDIAAQWDAIDNVGYGEAHSSDTKTWKDLTGNGWDLTSSGNYGWKADSYRFARGQTSFGNTDGFMPSLGGTWTFEAFVKADANNRNNYSGVMGAHGGSGTGFIMGQYEDGRYSCCCMAWGGDNYYALDTFLPTDEFVHLVVTADATTGKGAVYANGVLLRTKDFGTGGSTFGDARFYLGNAYMSADTGRTFSGDIYCARVYKQALSKEEILKNLKIDRVRFGGVNIYPVTDVYRQSEIVNLDVAVSSTPTGTVTPAVGSYQDIVGQLPLECSSDHFYTQSDILYECFGSVLTQLGSETAVTNNALTYTFNPEGSGSWTLTWQWKLVGYKLTVTQSGRDASKSHVELSAEDYEGGYYAVGSTVTAKAVSDTDQLIFDHWEGDVPEGQALQAQISIPMTAVKSLKAIFKPTYLVFDATANTLSDGNNVFAATAENGKLTLGKPTQALTWEEIDLTLPMTATDSQTYVITELARDAFINLSITRVKLPETLEVIGQGAFNNCKKLVSVEPLLPANVRVLGFMAFTYDSALTNDLVLGQSCEVEIVKEGDNSSQFSQCSKLGNIYLGTGVKNVPQNCFHSCSTTKEVEILGATNIAHHAFYGCGSLKKVVLSPCLESIGRSAFDHCGQLKSVTPFFPDTLRHLGFCAFLYTQVTNSMTILSKDAVFFEEVGTDGGSQFSEVYKIPSIELGRGVTNIPNAFNYAGGSASALKEVTARGVLQRIGGSAFRNQHGLKDFRLNGYPEMDAEAFRFIGDNQIRFSVPYNNALWDAYLADTTKVTPWDELDEPTQAAYYTRFGSDAKKPFGRTIVTDRLIANQWVTRWNPLPTGMAIIIR